MLLHNYKIEEGLRNADGTAIPQEPAVASPVAIAPDPVVEAPAVLPPLPRQFPLDEAFTNPRDDFMSIERLPSADLPVALASPVGQPAPRAPNTVGGAKLDFFERLPSDDLDFFQTLLCHLHQRNLDDKQLMKVQKEYQAVQIKQLILSYLTLMERPRWLQVRVF